MLKLKKCIQSFIISCHLSCSTYRLSAEHAEHYLVLLKEYEWSKQVLSLDLHFGLML